MVKEIKRITFSNIVILFSSRRMRFRKLYEIGGAYRATILAEGKTMRWEYYVAKGKLANLQVIII